MLAKGAAQGLQINTSDNEDDAHMRNGNKLTLTNIVEEEISPTSKS